jgi:hypothetical protein
MPIDDAKIIEIAKTVATKNLHSSSVSNVTSEDVVDSVGRDALQITIVLTSGSSERITGEQALKTLVDIQDSLQRQGEQRLPIIAYATEDELSEIGNS